MNNYFIENRLLGLQVAKELLVNFSEVQREILDFCSKPESLLEYPNYTVNNRPIYQNYWKAAPLTRFKGEYVELHSSPESSAALEKIIAKNKELCKVTTDIFADLESKGYLANSFISRLIPGSTINPHVGWTPNWVRVHLGISCDPQCSITIGEETRTWQEGKILAFIDGPPTPHSVRHRGTKERIILSFDISIKYLESLGL